MVYSFPGTSTVVKSPIAVPRVFSPMLLRTKAISSVSRDLGTHVPVHRGQRHSLAHCISSFLMVSFFSLFFSFFFFFCQNKCISQAVLQKTWRWEVWKKDSTVTNTAALYLKMVKISFDVFYWLPAQLKKFSLSNSCSCSLSNRS